MTDDRRPDGRDALVAGDVAGALGPYEIARLATLLADPATWIEPPTEFEDVVVAAVAHAHLAPGEGAHRSWWRRGRIRTDHRPRRRVVTGAVAAAAAIGIAIGSVALTGGDPHADFAARLTATALAPGARASADISHRAGGFRVRLECHDLPRLRAGEYYQGWLKDTAGNVVSIGSFSASGGGYVTLWSGVSPHDFSTMTVTIETTDGNPAPSSLRVLTGVVRAD